MYEMNSAPDLIAFSISYAGEPEQNKDNALHRAMRLAGGEITEKRFDYSTWQRQIRFAFTDLSQAQGAQKQAQILCEMIGGETGISIGPLERHTGREILH